MKRKTGPAAVMTVSIQIEDENGIHIPFAFRSIQTADKKVKQRLVHDIQDLLGRYELMDVHIGR